MNRVSQTLEGTKSAEASPRRPTKFKVQDQLLEKSFDHDLVRFDEFVGDHNFQAIKMSGVGTDDFIIDGTDQSVEQLQQIYNTKSVEA